MEQIRHTFADCMKSAKIVDRRAAPNHGYRAVHVIVYPESMPVEIQVRTFPQDLWAQAIERLGDEWVAASGTARDRGIQVHPLCQAGPTVQHDGGCLME